MAVNDVYQLRVEGLYQGQDCVNVFYYQQLAGGVGGAADLLNEFVDNVWNLVQIIQVASYQTFRFQVINGNNNADQVEQVVDIDGLDTIGLRLPAFIAAGFRGQRVGIGLQYAYKRIAGIGAYIDVNGQWSPAIRAQLADVAVGLGALLEGALGSYSPVILTGGFSLGIAPVVSYSLQQPWVYDLYPTAQRTRQSYLWVAPT